jgi:hypothetical protein
MAQIDPNIALGFRMPQIQDPVAATARAQEIGVNALKMNEMQRGLESQNKLRALFSQGVDVSTPEGFKQLAAVDPATALKLRTEALQGRKLQAETGAAEFKLDKDKIDRAITDIANFSTAQDAFNNIQKRVQAGELPVDKAQFLIGQLNSMPYEKFQMTQLRNLLGAKDKLTLEETARSNKVKEGIQQGQLDLSRQGQKLQYGPDVVANTVTDAAGNVTQFNRFGQVIGKPGAVAKPSATFEKTAALQKQTGRDLDLAIKELTEATKDKGLIDQSTGSGAGRLVDVAAGFAGQATPGAIAIAKLKPIADMTLKMVPRFEGPQSDKDTQSYKEAAGQLADPSLPTEIRKQAGKEVLRLMKARKGQFVNEAMANEGIGAGGVDTSNPLLK